MDMIDVAQRRQQEEIDQAISARQRVACTADALLLKHCGEALIGTWGHGATLVQVLDTLRWARRRAC